MRRRTFLKEMAFFPFSFICPTKGKGDWGEPEVKEGGKISEGRNRLHSFKCQRSGETQVGEREKKKR